MKQFTFFWRDGLREVLTGDSPADAANRAGYGGGAMRALDFWANGDNNQYEYRDREWYSTDPEFLAILAKAAKG